MFTQAKISPWSVTIIHDRTPLHWAAERGAVGVARVLREVGKANGEAKDSKGGTPLDLAKKSTLIRSEKVREAMKKALSSESLPLGLQSGVKDLSL